jgi:hypothetical protein
MRKKSQFFGSERPGSSLIELKVVSLKNENSALKNVKSVEIENCEILIVDYVLGPYFKKNLVRFKNVKFFIRLFRKS